MNRYSYMVFDKQGKKLAVRNFTKASLMTESIEKAAAYYAEQEQEVIFNCFINGKLLSSFEGVKQ